MGYELIWESIQDRFNIFLKNTVHVYAEKAPQISEEILTDCDAARRCDHPPKVFDRYGSWPSCSQLAAGDAEWLNTRTTLFWGMNIHLPAIWRFSKVEGLWPIAIWCSLQVYHWIWAKPLYRGSHHLGCLPWSWYVDHAPPKFWFHGPIRSPKCFGTSQWGRTRLLTLPSSNLPRKSPGPSFLHKKKMRSESGSSCER